MDKSIRLNYFFGPLCILSLFIEKCAFNKQHFPLSFSRATLSYKMKFSNLEFVEVVDGARKDCRLTLDYCNVDDWHVERRIDSYHY